MVNSRLCRTSAAAVGLLVGAALCLAQPFPSFVLDTTVVLGPSLNRATGTSVAFGPDTGLVVWVESHSLRGARIDRDGQLIDTIPLTLTDPCSGPTRACVPT
jgi:hypothetical protein